MPLLIKDYGDKKGISSCIQGGTHLVFLHGKQRTVATISFLT